MKLLSLRLLASCLAGSLLLCSVARGADASDTAVDTRGPAGRRHNYWWWLALGLSGFFVLLLLLLLFLSWYCCARRRGRHRCSRHHGADKQRHLGDEVDGPSDGAFSTSPDMGPTRNGSHDTSDGTHPRSDGGAAVAATVSTYRNTAVGVGKLGYELEAHADVENGQEGSGFQHQQNGRRRIVLAGGGGAGRNKRDSPARQVSPPQPTRSSATPVAAWTNTPAAWPPCATAGAPIAVNPLQPASVHQAEEEAVAAEVGVEAVVTQTTPLAAPADGATAGHFLSTPLKDAIVAAHDVVAAGPPSPEVSPVRVVDVPVAGAAPSVPTTTVPSSAQRRHQRQQQLAKSPTRAAVMAHSITTAERAATSDQPQPTTTTTTSSAKQYFFGYQRKPAVARAPTTRPVDVAIATATMQESPDNVPMERQSSPSPRAQPHDGGAGHTKLSPPSVQAAAEDRSRRSATPPSVMPDNVADASISARPSSATPYNSHVFSPLRMTGVEGEGQQAVSEAVGGAALAPVHTDRPPRHDRPTPMAAAVAPPSLSPPRSPQLAPVATAGVSAVDHRPQSKKRIELFRRGHHNHRQETSPGRTRGRSGSAPAAHHRPPLSSSPATAAATPLSSATVTKGVPQLFFGKRDASPVRPPTGNASSRSSSPSAGTRHQRPPRPDSAAVMKHNGQRRTSTPVQLSAVQLTQASLSALLPSGGPTTARDAAAAAAALVGSGGRTSSSRQESPSHYGSVTSSQNGGNSPSRTSLGRVRTSSKVRFLDQDGVSVNAGSAGGGGGEMYGQPAGGMGQGGSRQPSPSTTPTSSALKGRPLSVPAAKSVDQLPELPPVPATAQVVIEQGRRTAAPTTVQPTASAIAARQQPVLRTTSTTSPSRHRGVRGRSPPDALTPPSSAATASPLETLPGARSTATAAAAPAPTRPPRSPPPPADVPRAAAVRAAMPAARVSASPARPAGDEVESLGSEASTMPAGMLADRPGERQTPAGAARHPQPSVSPPQQPLFSTVSPHSSARRAPPSDVQLSHPRHPSGIEVLRITRASGDVHGMFATSSAAQAEEMNGHHVVGGASLRTSGQLQETRRGESAGLSARHRARETEGDYASAAAAGLPLSNGSHYGSNRSNHRFASAKGSMGRRPR